MSTRKQITIQGQVYYLDRQDYKMKMEELGLSSLLDYIKELEQNADYTKASIKTDIMSYESQLDEQNSLLHDTLDSLGRLISYIEDTKKLNRSKMIEEINYICRDIENTI